MVFEEVRNVQEPFNINGKIAGTTEDRSCVGRLISRLLRDFPAKSRDLEPNIQRPVCENELKCKKQL